MADGAVDTRPMRGDAAGLCLRVLAGANQGASMPLADGPWTIGSGPMADITFAEPGLAENHLTLTIRDGTVRLTMVAPGVLVGGDELLPGSERDLPPLVPVAIGRTVFALGPADADWARIDTGLQQADPTAVQFSAPSADVSSGRDEASVPLGPAEPAQAQTDTADVSHLRRWKPVYSLIASLVGLLLVIAVVAVWLLLEGGPPLAAGPDGLLRARAAVAPLNLPALKIDQVENRIVVTGRVTDDRQLHELTRTLRGAGVHAEMRVRSDQALAELVRTVLKGYGVDVDIGVDNAGRITISGYADDSAKAITALERLRRDIADIGEFADEIVTPERARRDLESWLDAAGLATLGITNAPHVVTVSGMLDASRLDRWGSVADRFRERYGSRIRLQANVVSYTATAPKGVRVGPDPYIVMHDGRELRVGDALGQTGTITRIDTRRVRVRTANGEVDLPFARVPYWIVEDAK
jgi:type III secretion system YscD/HrpQ family protein